MLDGSSPSANDVADELSIDANSTRRQRRRFWDETEAVPEGLRLIGTIDTRPEADDGLAESPARRYWHWYALPQEGVRSGRKPVEWDVHVGDVAARVRALLQRLPLPVDIQAALLFAARCHDHGKRRRQFQTVLGNNRFPEIVLAKAGRRGGRLRETYRHEFGSLLDVLTLSPGSPEAAEWSHLSPEAQDLALHLIAAHHGRARPHFPSPDEDFDPDPPDAIAVEEVALETPRRFARLQRRYGRWGLAYLESLFRAADWHASAAPSRELDEEMLWPTEGTAGREVAS
jgi:CRISPR-associated endonuclease/helicase Cas3